MKVNGKRVMLTGAAGGIGNILARRLAEHGASVALIDYDAPALERLSEEIPGATAVPADLSTTAGCREAASQATRELGGVDILVNLAGMMSFCTYETEDVDRIARLVRVNLLAPMVLSKEILPTMLEQESGQIVNVGSMFGSIGFAYFTAYSASKFGLRGFSQALRRELADTPLSVTYISPRAVRTPINTDAIVQANRATGTKMDEPEAIAGKILRAIERGRKECYLGFPESLFARLNAIWPGLIDAGTRSQNEVARTFAAR